MGIKCHAFLTEPGVYLFTLWDTLKTTHSMKPHLISLLSILLACFVLVNIILHKLYLLKFTYCRPDCPTEP